MLMKIRNNPYFSETSRSWFDDVCAYVSTHYETLRGEASVLG